MAVKVLPQSLAADPDRLARFQREAEVLAALNHPNIAHIYGLEDAGGVKALVMELVEGPTLADRIAQGPVPIDEALPIAAQIADALEAAHERGIIHRDLKPANVKVRPDGTVKVLDFGLAKAIEPAGSSPGTSQSPTITTPAMMTGAGVILGTAAYMSPEQARGKAVDKRADIWAFGCVLFEMLTGKRAFEDEDVSMTLSKVLQREPDFDTLPATLSPTLATYLRRCLHKDPRQRIHDIADVRLALAGAFETAAPQAAQGVGGAGFRPGWRPRGDAGGDSRHRWCRRRRSGLARHTSRSAGRAPHRGHDIGRDGVEHSRRRSRRRHHAGRFTGGLSLAYESNESGREEVYVRPFSDVSGGRWQVSIGGGRIPLWSRNGQELFYVSPDSALMGVRVEPGPSWRSSTPARIIQAQYFYAGPGNGRTYDIAPDGRRFLMIKEGGGNEAAPQNLVVVQHWFEELKRLVPRN